MLEVEQLYQAWQNGGYILAIAIIAGGITRALRAWTPLFSMLPDKHKRWIPVIIAVLGAFGDAVISMTQSKPPTVVLISALIAAATAGVAAIGGHHFLHPEKHASPAPVTPRNDV